jgi:putative salt-induced outer membrane protein YdiY
MTSDALAGITATNVEKKYASISGPTGVSKSAVQRINIGFANTTGNTKTLNLNAKYSLSHMIQSKKYKPFKYNFQTTGYLTKNDSKKTAEEYTALLNGEQALKYQWLSYVSLGWLTNKFKNFQNKYMLAIGLGKVFIQNKEHRLVLKIGPACNIEQYYNKQKDNIYSSLNEYVEYRYLINPTSKFYMKLGAVENFDDISNDYETTGLIGLNFALNENISITLEQELAYDNLPPEGFKKSDSKSIIRVGYKF